MATSIAGTCSTNRVTTSDHRSLDEAASMMEVLEKRKSILGEEHSDTIMAIKILEIVREVKSKIGKSKSREYLDNPLEGREAKRRCLRC